MATFSIDIDSLSADDQVNILVGTSPGTSDVFAAQYTSTGSDSFSFTPTASTLYIDIQGFDQNTDAHTIRVDNVSIVDGSERITNGDFTSDTSGWTEVTATIASNNSQLLMTGFGGEGDPTVARQSFSTSYGTDTAKSAGGRILQDTPKKKMLKPKDDKEGEILLTDEDVDRLFNSSRKYIPNRESGLLKGQTTPRKLFRNIEN